MAINAVPAVLDESTTKAINCRAPFAKRLFTTIPEAVCPAERPHAVLVELVAVTSKTFFEDRGVTLARVTHPESLIENVPSLLIVKEDGVPLSDVPTHGPVMSVNLAGAL